MSVCKSTFTFLLKEGEDFEYQLEPFFLNTKSQEVEHLSASPNSTPRANKKPFGAILKIVKIDEDIIQILNKESEVLCLEVKRLSPLIDTDESRLKNALTDLKVKPTDELVNSMSQLVAKVSITNVANSP